MPRPKKTVEVEPLMAGMEESRAYVNAEKKTRSRRNIAGTIERTNRFTNIENGLVPFNYSKGTAKYTNMDVREACILCQKAYWNFAVFRNTIDLMTEFSIENIYFTGGSKKSKQFFEALLEKINIWALQDKFFREYFRSGNVFIHRFDGKIPINEVNKLTRVFKTKILSSKAENLLLPIRYVILNPVSIESGGNVSFVRNDYYKLLSDYEIERLRSPRSEEDKELYKALPPDIKKQINKPGNHAIRLPLDKDKTLAIFYKKQDYEPLAIPMGWPVLEAINCKAEMRKMDMAITRTMQQAILLITMGTEPDKGGVNQKNLERMQSLFINESVGRVLVSDYTTKAEFVIPQIGTLLSPEKYEVVERDINIGLNNILVGGEKYANQQTKTEVFMARLKQARQSFRKDFLMPEIKRISKLMGFKKFPQAHFEDTPLKQDYNMQRIYSRLIELGVLTPEEGMLAISDNRLPDSDSSVESQMEYKKLRDKGLYEPLLGGPETQKEMADKTQKGAMELADKNIKSQEKIGKEKAKEAAKAPKLAVPPPTGGEPVGRPAGVSTPQPSDRKPGKIGEKQSKALFSIDKIKDNMLLANKLEEKIKIELKKKFKLEELDTPQMEVVESIAQLVIANENSKNWNKVTYIRKYIKNPKDTNKEAVNSINEIACEHQVDLYLAGILHASRSEVDPCQE
jgi:hypothetical protein